MKSQNFFICDPSLNKRRCCSRNHNSSPS